MASTLSWIDDSDAQRKRIENALDAFTVRDTRDELGIGVIRDAFSDLLFPGTGSLQTRAAYLLFIPWMYRELEGQRRSSAEIARLARRRELQLIDVLKASDDPKGTIGVQAGALLRRLPSSIYWTGLGRLRIRRFPGSQDAYHRSLDAWYRRSQAARKTDDGEPDAGVEPNWHRGVPEAPSDWQEQASFGLRRNDALYLRECIRSAAGNSLLAQVDGHVVPGERTTFVWEHPVASQVQEADDPRSKALARQLAHAQLFSEVMHGAQILYNLLVAEGIAGREEWVADYRGMLSEWHDEIGHRHEAVREWALEDLWRLMAETGASVHPLARAFVESWVRLVGSPQFRTETAGNEAKTLITHREKWLKRALARIGNREIGQSWKGGSGLGRLDFRWSNAQVLLGDIALGVNGGRRAQA